MRFRDRSDAGKRLAALLQSYADDDVVVLALPHGGVPVAMEVARALNAQLDVLGVRKLGAPSQPEFGIGAIAEGGIRVVDRDSAAAAGLDEAAIAAVERRERSELQRRVHEYRGDRELPELTGRTVIVVDDGLATLLIDLLTPEEEQVDLRTRQLRFDIELLATRVAAAVDWLRQDERTQQLPVGLFGASTGAAAALLAAAQRPETVTAIVSRGGRPDLAGAALAEVRAPTLLIVGGEDRTVIGLNQQAQEAMAADVEVEIVPRATHLFEEPGALERVAELASDHFCRHLR